MFTPETAVSIEDVAVSSLADVARLPPPERTSSLKRLVAFVHTSAASVPNEVSVLDPLPHTAVAAAEAIVEVE